MLICYRTFDKYIIDVDFHIAFDLMFEHFIDEALICCTIFLNQKASFYNNTDFVGYECGILLTFRCHPSLIVSGEGIYEAQQLVP